MARKQTIKTTSKKKTTSKRSAKASPPPPPPKKNAGQELPDLPDSYGGNMIGGILFLILAICSVISYFNTEGKPLLVEVNNDGTPGRGYASVTREYDDAGNITREDYFDENGNPVVAAAGYAAIEKDYGTYSGAAKVTAERYFGTDEKPILLDGKGYASLTREYDEAGNVSKESYFDEKGEPQGVTIRYEVRPDGVFKFYNGKYIKLKGTELNNFCEAVRIYHKLVKTHLYF